MIDCLGCYDWHGCKGKDYFEPGEIQYCFNFILWFLKNLPDFNDGSYPRDIRDTGYIDFGKGTPNQTDKGLTCKIILADIMPRIERCGTDGKLLIAEGLLGVSLEGLNQEARDALYYSSGKRAKEMGYRRWLSSRHYRQQNRPTLAVGRSIR